MAKLFANSGDPDQMPHSVASDLGLHCLLITLLWVSRLQWVNRSPGVKGLHLCFGAVQFTPRCCAIRLLDEW